MRSLTACVIIPNLRRQLVVTAQPKLVRHPLVVATHIGDRGVVLDCCMYATTYGIQVGQSVWEARRRCPALRVTMVSLEQVVAATAQVLEVLRQHANTVRRESFNIWTLPLVALGAGFQAAPQVARQIQRDLYAATSLRSALVLSIQRQAAHILAQILQPPSYRVIRPGNEAATLAPLPVRLLPGVGPRTEAQLAQLGVTTIGDLAAIPEPLLRSVLGTRSQSLAALACGQDGGAGQKIADVLQQTWCFEAAPCADARHLHSVLYLLAEQIGRDLRQWRLGTGRLMVQITLVDGRSLQCAHAAHARLDLDHDLAQLARQALATLQQKTRLAVRAITLTAADLGALQVDLFTDTDRARRRQQAVDHIKARYGAQAITIAALLSPLHQAA